jgi:hypothetical protein
MTGRGVVAVALLLFALTVVADAPPAPGPMKIPSTSAAIQLDGDLSDAGWQGAAVVDRFYETSPGDNTVPKVKTIAYLTYDRKYFYIGIRAEDPNPKQIRAPYVDRDAVIGTDDNIAVFLDTRNDQRSAIELRVNPRGIQGDGIFNDANGNEDFSPDFYYDTAARIDAGGWSAEYRIPFSSLRYGSADPQTWNILIWRNYPRDFRYGFHSAPLPRGSNCLVCHTHPITGLTGLPEAGHFIAAPYVTAQQAETLNGPLGAPLERGNFKTDAGIDVKWTPSANHAVDLTLNPDFSQIEADVAQVTVNRRFAVFFPEKRPFFLEGFDLFDTPLQVAYTRTITSPQYGARATGKSGNTAYTILTTEDRGGGLTIIPGALGSDFALQDFKSRATIARVRHDLGTSFIGAVVTDREIQGGGHNRVIGPDFQWRPSESDAVTAQLLYSDNENPLRTDSSPAWNGASSTSHAFSAAWNHQQQRYDAGVGVNDVGDDFRADLGFIPQVGYREANAGFGLRFYPEHSKLLRFVRPSVVVDHQEDQDGNTIQEFVSLGVNGFGAKNFNFGFIVHPGERIRVRTSSADRILTQTWGDLFLQIDPSRRLPRISMEIRAGDSIDFSTARVGRGASLFLAATMRPMDRLDLQLTGTREWLDVEGDRLFTSTIERLRAQYSFSNKSQVRGIVQYVKTDPVADFGGSFLGSLLYSYKINWQTVLFVGYGDDRALVDEGLGNERLLPTDRSLFLKVSYAFLR